MSCKSCKKTNSEIYNESIDNSKIEGSTLKKINNYLARFIIFLLLCIIIVPLIIPITVYTLFITTVTNRGINLVPALVYLGRKLFKDENFEDNDDEFDDEEDDGDNFEDDKDYDNLSNLEYEPVDANEITIIK